MKPHIPSDFVKIRRGGECFWAEVMNRDANGAVLRCDSHTSDPATPSYGSVFHVNSDEEIYGWVQSVPRFRVVK